MTSDEGEVEPRPVPEVSLGTIGKEWLRLGCIGFGGPPTHIVLLRRMCVEERRWIEAKDFEDAIATTNLLPGPGIDAAGHLLRLASHPPHWILGAAAGAGAAVPAVALNAAWGLVPASRIRTGTKRAQKARWLGYAVLGGAAAATIGPYLVIVLVACGVTEIVVRRQG